MWTRTAALSHGPAAECCETWTQVTPGGGTRSFQVDVTVGKPLDVVALKGASTEETREYSAFLQRTADRLYQAGRPRCVVDECPCCGCDTNRAIESFAIFAVPYHRCPVCGHTFVRSQPSQDVMTELFAQSDEHATTYTDRAGIETRLQQVMQPKLDWVLRTFTRHNPKTLRSVLDVGAAGGHFVEVAKRAGLTANGFEISKASRQFAKSTFDIDLDDADFLRHPPHIGMFDVLTFWGLLEYTPRPKQFLACARKWLTPGGMLIVEVPRVDAFGAAVQVACAETVARHLDPTSHVNVFSDASLATALVGTGFRPVAAWYFGMDAYELFMQMALRLGEAPLMERLAPLIPMIQGALDVGRVCDDIVIAAVLDESWSD